MAPKSKKEPKGKVEETEAPTREWSRPSGMKPTATVQSRHGPQMVSRQGKGFSKGELGAAGIPVGRAIKRRVPLDARRRSTLESNVNALRGWVSAPVQKAAEEGEIKRVEEKLEQVEKEVAKEVTKEVGKVKKGVKKAKKEVAAAVEKPVKGRRKKEASTE